MEKFRMKSETSWGSSLAFWFLFLLVILLYASLSLTSQLLYVSFSFLVKHVRRAWNFSCASVSPSITFIFSYAVIFCRQFRQASKIISNFVIGNIRQIIRLNHQLNLIQTHGTGTGRTCDNWINLPSKEGGAPNLQWVQIWSFVW